jgi:plastocyanin
MENSGMKNKMTRSIFAMLFVGVGVGWLLVGCGSKDTGLSQVADAGSITGKVVFEGKAPKMRPLPVDADPACAKMHANDPLLTDFLILGEGQTMANVLIQVISPIPEGDYPVPSEPAVLSQKGCQYGPHVFVVRKGQELKILNPDAILHNIHFMPKVNREFNRAMGKEKKEISFTPDKAEPIFSIKCDVHSWMGAFCAVLDHPFYKVTEKDGMYSLDNLPAGEYEIEAWHEKLGIQTAKVVVKEGEDSEVNFSFARPKSK